MRVKKFNAKNMKEALQLVKLELGPEAIILAAKEKRLSSGMGTEVEVTAAVSESTLHKKKFVESRLNTETKSKFQSATAKKQKETIERAVERKLAERARMQEDIEKEMQKRAQEVERARRPHAMTQRSYIDIMDDEEIYEQAPPAKAVVRAPAKAQQKRPTSPQLKKQDYLQAQELLDQESGLSNQSINRIRSATQEALRASRGSMADLFESPAKTQKPSPPGSLYKQEKNYVNIADTDDDEVYAFTRLQPAQKAPTQVNIPKVIGESNSQSAPVEHLHAEIERLQGLLKQTERPKAVVHTHPGAEYGLHFDMSFMFQKLYESGVSPDAIAEILLKAQSEMDPVQSKKRPLVDAYVAKWILSHTRVVEDSYQGRTHVFVGPAGSGKTSMLVKWASYLAIQKKKRVAIITTDSQKVGAVDQLKIYAQILNVPFIVIRQHQDWNWILGQFAHIDHFLVDMPGLQLKELHEIDQLRQLLPPSFMAPVSHLVLSCTAKDSDSLEIGKRYRLADCKDIIFTNLDQSVQHGVIYNMQRELEIPLNSFGIGSRIPEDFEEASKERVLDLIFKLTRLQRGAKSYDL